MAGSQRWQNDSHISGEGVQPDEKSIEDVNLTDTSVRSTLKFVIAFATGAFVFLIPIQWQGQTTIPLDVIMTLIQNASMTAVDVFSLGLIAAGGILTTISELHYRNIITVSEQTEELLQLDYWRTSVVFWAFRVIAIGFAVSILLNAGPAWMLVDPIVNTAWGALVITVALVIPIGSIFVNLLAELGGLQFIGTLAQPIMRPVFDLPGRSALDSAASWLGSFSIGYYLTRNVFDRGGYNKRDVFVICTCFATANVGTVGAVAALLDILHIFPVIIALYLVATLIVAAILVRVPPLSRVPEEYIAEPDPEPEFTGTVSEYLHFAFSEGVKTAREGDSILRTSIVGLVDGLKLAGMVVGSVLTMSMIVLLVEHYTPVFEYIATPFIPIMDFLGIPDPQTATVGIILGGAEFFIGATFVVEASLTTQVFVVIVTGAQAIFFSAPAPMMVDMFDDIPMRFRDLFVLLVMRTALLVPIAAVLTHGAAAIGLI
ncbi:nucleoside recognition domain-containing protein [Halobacterium sp. R2-5]|uniref:YjiH family protein n=1 Tax=Halobacterium sp. R2-5 TaxID=2715751 RepID=UPI00141F0E54|nr:nucleoside recognition domain-containing protein [Halobacterium sp. R2-5]NIC01073.1 YjiH family protein [Halobacterium sp. R2-5]